MAGIGAGVALALIGALVAGFAGGGFGSLDDDGPTAIAPGAGQGGGPVEQEPTLAPEAPTPTEELVEPTEPAEPTPAEVEPTATTAPAAATPTLPPEPTLAE